MLNIMVIPNADRFLSLVDHCHGDVNLQLPDGSNCNLKQDQVARQMLRMMRPSHNGISISLSNTKDARMFLRYMTEAVRK